MRTTRRRAPTQTFASIALDALLLRGDLAELRAAGIRFRSGTDAAIARELRAIPTDRHHIIDHHYIAGRLKPSCWRPWADDPVGFPQAWYLAALADLRARSGLTTEQLIYRGRAEGWLVVPSLEAG
jgi:hypothetical protein